MSRTTHLAETDFQGEVRRDSTKPDSELGRALDSSRARRAFGFEAQTTFEEGLGKTIQRYETSGRRRSFGAQQP